MKRIWVVEEWDARRRRYVLNDAYASLAAANGLFDWLESKGIKARVTEYVPRGKRA